MNADGCHGDVYRVNRKHLNGSCCFYVPLSWTLMKVLYCTASSMPLWKWSTVDWCRHTNTQKCPKQTSSNQHLIYNMVAVPWSFAMRKLCEAEALFIHRKKPEYVYSLNLWTEKMVCSCWHRELHIGFSFHTGWPLHLHSTTELQVMH